MLKPLLTGIVVAVVLSGALYALVERVWRRSEAGGAVPGLGSVAGIAAGFAGAYVAVRGWPAFPPRESAHWLVYLGIAMIALGRLGRTKPGSWARWAGYAAAVGLLLWGLAPPLTRVWSFWGAIAWIAGSAVAGVGALRAWGGLCVRFQDPRWVSGYLTLLAGGVALAMSLSGSLLVAQMAGALAAAVAVQGAVLIWTRGNPRSWAVDVYPSVVILVLGILLWGHWYASLEWGSLGFLAAGLFAPWLGRWGALTGKGKRKAEWVAGAAVGLCVLGALVTAYYASLPLYY